MAETTQLIQQAKGGGLSLSELYQQSLGGGTPNITQPQQVATPPSSLSNLYEEFVGQAAQPAPPAPTAPQALPVEQTQPLTPEMQALAEQGGGTLAGDIARTAGSTALEATGAVARGTLYGITEMSDMLANGIRRLPVVGAPVRGFDYLMGNDAEKIRTLTQVVKDSLPPESKEFGNRVAVEVGKSLPMLALSSAVAIQSANAGRVPILVRGMVDDLRRFGTKGLLMLEASISAIGAGAGELAVDAREGLGLEGIPEPIAKMTASLVATLGVGTVANLATTAKSMVSRGRLALDVETKAKAQLGRAIERQTPAKTPTYPELIKEAGELEAAVPGLKLGTAEATREPGLRRFQDVMVREESEIAQAFAGQAKSNMREIGVALRHAGTDIEAGDVDALTHRMQSYISDIEQDVASRMEQASRPVRQAQAAATGDLGAPAIAMREAVQSAETSLKKLGDELFGNLEANIGNNKLFNFKGKISRALVSTKTPNNRLARNIPEIFDKSPILRQVRDVLTSPDPKVKPKTEASFAEIREIIIQGRKEAEVLQRKISLGMADNVEAATLTTLNQVRKAAEEELDKLLNTEFSTAYKAAKTTFRGAAKKVRTDFTKRFRTLDRSGQFTISDSIKKGDQLLKDAEITRGYLEVMSGFGQKEGSLARFANPDAVNELTRYARESFMDAATKNGVVDVRAMKKWLQNHAGINEMPELKTQLSNVKSAQELVDSIQASAGAYHQTNDFAILRNFMDGADPRVVVREAMKGPQAARNMAAIQRVVGIDDAAKRGLRKAVWQNMLDEVQGPITGLEDISRAVSFDDFPILNPDAMEQFLTRNRDVMSQLYTPSELKHLKQLQIASTRATREAKDVLIPSGKVEYEKDINDTAGLIHTLVSRAMPFRRGIVPSVPYTASSAVSKRIINSWSEKQRAVALHAAKEALFDRNAMEVLRLAAKDPSSALFRSRFANYAETHSNAISVIADRLEAWENRRRAKEQENSQ